MKDLSELRLEIDQIDHQIVDLYEKRMKVAEGVAEYKISVGKPVFDKERENQKLENLSGLAHSDFNAKGVKELFSQIMAMSRKKQYQLLTQHGIKGQPELTRIDALRSKGCRIVYQGAKGAYSQAAMLEFFGEDCDGHHVASWREAMEAIAKGQADYAVLPIENSTAGIVSENYDLLMEYDNYIVSEQTIQIKHALLGTKDAQLSDLTEIYSHPQSLAQCANYLEKHSQWKTNKMENNALAARKVMEDGKKNQAAIAGEINAKLYDLKILDTCIQDIPNNSTRFIIVSNQKVYLKDAKHISISFELPNETGSLYKALSNFIYNDINMINIQSRPIPDRNWEYRFVIDFEGNLDDVAVCNALRGLKEETRVLRILGTY